MTQVPLADVCEVFNGKTPSKSEQRSSGYPVLKIKDVNENGIFRGKFESFVDDDFSEQHSSKKVRKDDILILNAAHNADYVGSKGYFATEEVEGAIATGEWLIVRANKEHVESSFVWHWIQSPSTRFQIKKLVKGIHLYPRDVSRVKFPLYELQEQKRIADILDKADAIRRKRQQAIELANEFLRSVFLDMFGDPITNPKGWNMVELGKVCGVGSSKRVFVDELTDSGVPFFRGTEVGQLGDNEDILPELFISEEHYEKLKKDSGVPNVGDLLLPSICHDGRIWKVDYEQPFYFKDGRVLWIKVDQKNVNSDYLRNHLKALFLANYSKIASGTTFAELKIVNLKTLKILVPPLAIQKKYSEIACHARQISDRHKRTLEQEIGLFHSLSQCAFRGDL